MNNSDLQALERELQEFRPASVPPDLVRQLALARPAAPVVGPMPASTPVFSLAAWLRLLIPATAVLATAWFVSRQIIRTPEDTLETAAVVLNEVQLDRQFVSAFDAIARLPNGTPIRLRCSRWDENVILRDTATGLEIRQQRPRMNVIPVAFETD